MRKVTVTWRYSIRIVFGYILLLVFWMVIRHPLYNALTNWKHQNLFILFRVLDVLITSVFFLFLTRRVERDVLQSQRDYETLVDLARDPIIIHRNGIILDANKYAVSLVGCSSEQQLLGRRIHDFVAQSHHLEVSQRIQDIMDGAIIPSSEITLIPHVGLPKTVEVTGMPVKFKGDLAIQVVVRDVTRTKQAEQQLSRMASLFQRFEENSADLVSMLDANGQVTYISPSHEKLVMTTPDSNSIFGIQFHPDDIGTVRVMYHRMIETMQSQRIEIRIKLRQQTWGYFETYGNPVIDAQGKYNGAVFVTREITERKLTEELLRRSDKLSAVGQLAAGLAHEVRNPVTVVQGFLQLMQVSRTVEDYHIRLMIGELKRIETILTEFLILAKPSSPEQMNVDVRNCAQEVVALVSTQAILKSIDIQVKTGFGQTQALCNASQLKQVLVNLLKNAIEAMDKGGTITVYIESVGERLGLRIVDEGPGMPPELVERLGEPFFTTKSNGTGLGLLVSRQLIQNNGGTFAIQSEMGIGTEIRITLRVTTEGQESAEYEMEARSEEKWPEAESHSGSPAALR